MNRLIRNSRAVGKVTLTFTSLILILSISIVALSLILSNRIDTLQTTNNSLESQLTTLQNNLSDLQSQYDQLNSDYQQLQSGNPSSQSSQIINLQNQIESLESQIASLESELMNATATISDLRGQTGILPSYMDLGWVGPDLNNGNYFLQLAIKNTGTVPINQIYITIDSVQMAMTFTYLNDTVNAVTPLPPYETATGIQDVTPPVIHTETYPLLIQATATNGTIYTYQTTITSHV